MLKIPLTAEGVVSAGHPNPHQHQRHVQRDRDCPWLAADRNAGKFGPTNHVEVYIFYDVSGYLHGLPPVCGLVSRSGDHSRFVRCTGSDRKRLGNADRLVARLPTGVARPFRRDPKAAAAPTAA